MCKYVKGVVKLKIPTIEKHISSKQNIDATCIYNFLKKDE
jgi:hypothetical protein